MSFNPTFDRVCIQTDSPRSVSSGGIYLPPQAQEKSATGVVKAIGSGRYGMDGKRIPVGVAIGDRVMFNKFDGTEFDSEDIPPKHYVVVSEPSILGVLT